MSSIRIGSRGSALALWQAERVRALLAARSVASEITIIRTSGDEGSQRPTDYVEGKGLFTRELEDALLENRIDAAVHSLKDLGAALPPGLELAAFPEREDVRDAIVTRIPGGSTDFPGGPGWGLRACAGSPPSAPGDPTSRSSRFAGMSRPGWARWNAVTSRP